jgi:hypothetical protein
VILVPSDASTETDRTGTGAYRSRASAAVPAQRAPGQGEMSSPQSGPFTGLVTALRTATAPRPLVPAAHRPPTGGRLAAVCAWAAVLSLAGVLVGLIGGITLLVAHPAHWYLPSLLISGGVGIALTACAFLTVRQERLPWLLLSGGTAALITSAIFTATAS